MEPVRGPQSPFQDELSGVTQCGVIAQYIPDPRQVIPGSPWFLSKPWTHHCN